MSRVKPASGSLTSPSPVSTSDTPRVADVLDGSREAALLAEVQEYRRRFEDLLAERAAEMRAAAARVRQESDDRRRAEADARASEQLFRILVERSSDLIMVVDAEARVDLLQPVRRAPHRLSPGRDHRHGRRRPDPPRRSGLRRGPARAPQRRTRSRARLGNAATASRKTAPCAGSNGRRATT